MFRSLRKSAALAGVLVALASTPALAAGEVLDIDAGHSSILFGIKHLNIARFWGRFQDVSGKIEFDPAAVEKSTVKLEIKTESVNTGIEKRDNHLRNPDFFNSKQFPAITFVSKSVKKTAENEFTVTGDLTARGKTKEVSIPMKMSGSGQDPWGKFRRGFEGSFKIQRADFDMGYMPDALGAEVELMISVETVRQ